MKKTDEMKREIEQKRQEVDRLQREEQMDAAHKAAMELNSMVNEYEIAAALEASNFEKFTNQAKFNATPEPTDKAVLRNRAFNKLVFDLGRLTDAEREAYYNVSGNPPSPAQLESVPEKGGYLVPEERIAQLQEYRQAYTALKDYVTVVPTDTTSGRWPTMPYQKLEFVPFEEMTDIVESDVRFSEATYMTSDRALILPISRQLVDDADINIMDVIGRQLAEGAVHTENKVILEPLEDLIDGSDSTVSTITTYKSLNKALIGELDSVYYNQAKIYTNQSGLLYLADLDDGNNKPLFTGSPTAPDKFLFKGKEIVVIPNSTLPNSGSGANVYAPFFVGDMRQFLYFFERQGLLMEMSRERYWHKHGLALKAVSRFGVVVFDKNAMIPLKVKI